MMPLCSANVGFYGGQHTNLLRPLEAWQIFAARVPLHDAQTAQNRRESFETYLPIYG